MKRTFRMDAYIYSSYVIGSFLKWYFPLVCCWCLRFTGNCLSPKKIYGSQRSRRYLRERDRSPLVRIHRLCTSCRHHAPLQKPQVRRYTVHYNIYPAHCLRGCFLIRDLFIPKSLNIHFIYSNSVLIFKRVLLNVEWTMWTGNKFLGFLLYLFRFATIWNQMLHVLGIAVFWADVTEISTARGTYGFYIRLLLCMIAPEKQRNVYGKFIARMSLHS